MSRPALREVEPNTARSAQSLIRQIVKPAQQNALQALHERRAYATARPVAAAAGIANISARLSGCSSSVQHAGRTHEAQSVVERSSSTEASRTSTRTAAAHYELRSEHESTAYREMANRTRSLQAAGRKAVLGAGGAVLARQVN
jgi:hypothetical protein